MVIMLYIRFLDLIHFITKSLYPFASLPLFPPTPAPGNYFYILYFNMFDFFF